MRALVAGLLLAAGSLQAGPAERPNILVLMAEDLSPRIGAFGDAVAVTPRLDQLAREGVRYHRVFTTAGVCAPSRAAQILGVHQVATGSQHMRTSTRPDGAYTAVPPPQVKAYPELLRAAGYYTFTDNKLDYQFSGPFKGTGPFTLWSDEGVRDWRGRAEGQPFYGLVNFMVTHESGVFTPLGSLPLSRRHLLMQLYRWWSIDVDIPRAVQPEQVVLPPYYPDTPTVRRDLARHYNNIAAMDAEVGAILDQLAQDGLADNTIVIWTTDHGDGLPRAKRELYDSGLQVPMIIRWPARFRPAGLAPGQRDHRLVSFVDFAPTVLALAGVTAPDYLQGQDFASDTVPPRRYIFAARDRIDAVMDRQRAVRDERFKYIRSSYPEQAGGHPLAFRDNIDMVREMRALYAAGKLNPAQRQWFEAPGQERLFDLQADPFELNDVSADPRYAADLQRLRSALDVWTVRVGDVGDEPEAAMVARFGTGGEDKPVTAAPQMRIDNGELRLRAVTEGSSLAYRLDDGPWQIYRGPVALGRGQAVTAKAVRYGWLASDTVTGVGH
ncbi:sulfatase family protein [Parahaliea mediterranea]|uniref:sulfatase family protein n=1 Tax=Parahaliea mediterranea TaxID=651086 RepID=UPI0014758084|nr:sulfatase [Parahaliea mediterranea]